MTVSAAAGAATGQNYPVTVTATPSVSMSSQSLALALDVAPAPGTLPNNRTDFIRTDGTAGSMVYDPGHQLIYASDRNGIALISCRRLQKRSYAAYRSPRRKDST